MNGASSVLVIVAVSTGAAHCGSAEPGEPGADVRAEFSTAMDVVPWAGLEPWTIAELDVASDRVAVERFHARLGPTVTSSATAGDGTRYVAGVFSGSIQVGVLAITSHGGDDVFLARIRSDGRAEWARAVGSKGRESGVKVSFEDERVRLVAMTDGAVDCGRGPLQAWSSEAFFVCTFGPDGAPIGGASFPTGRR